jgi:hypothetical protein
MSSTVSTQNTTSKLGAHLRWMLEKEGVNPERVIVSLGVGSEDERNRMIVAFDRDFDRLHMKRGKDFPGLVIVHGVPIVIVVNNKIESA